MAAIPVSTPTFIVQCGTNGQVIVSELTGGDLSSATLSQLYSGQRDIPGPVKLIEHLIMRNLS